mgnify:CR=1 FL=1
MNDGRTCDAETEEDLAVALRRVLAPLLREGKSDRDIVLTVLYLVRVEAWLANHLFDLGQRAAVFFDGNVIALSLARKASLPPYPRQDDPQSTPMKVVR